MQHALTLALVGVVLLAACDAGGPVVEPVSGPALVAPGGTGVLVDPAQFLAGVAHPLWPMHPGARWVYEGVADGIPRREIVTVRPDARVMLGVECTEVVQEVFEDGEAVEITTHWFAQDRDGNLWRFGEVSVELGGEQPVRAGDSWEAGVDGLPWIALGADPRPGDFHVGLHPGGTDRIEVVAVDVVASVAAGTFSGCVQTTEVDPEDPTDVDQILYAPGVGPIEERAPDTRLELVTGP